MTISTVAVLSPGDMGHSVGAVLHDHGLRVVTCLANRSERTRELAREAGFEDLPDLDAVVRESDVVISIVVPSRALELAKEVTAALERTGASVLFADCNAVAPRTVKAAAAAIEGAGSRFADAGIIGPPPRRPGTRIYTSGPGAEEFAQLNASGLTINVLPGEIGQASGLKACYAALTKGLQALGIELLVAAHAMGLDDVLAAEQAESMSTIRTYLERSTPVMPSKAHRWIGEMEEIGTCFEDLGMTPRLLQGVADMYRFIAETPIGKETPENRDESRDLTGVIEALGDALSAPAAQRA